MFSLSLSLSVSVSLSLLLRGCLHCDLGSREAPNLELQGLVPAVNWQNQVGVPC